jgi:hypothetical protein
VESEAILDAGRSAVADRITRALEVDEFGVKGLVVRLEDMVRKESGHAAEIERSLGDWPS